MPGPTCGLDVLHDALGHGAVVEDVGPFLRYPLVRVGQTWESNDVVFFQDVSLGITEDLTGEQRWKETQKDWYMFKMKTVFDWAVMVYISGCFSTEHYGL